MKRIVAVGIALAGMNHGFAVLASQPTAPLVQGRPTVVIDASRINLSSARGRHQLQVRLASAVEAVCGSYFAATPDDEDRIRLCRRNAYADLSPSVAALVARHGGGRYAASARS